MPFDVSGPKSFFSAPNIGPRFQAVLRPFLWSPQFNAHKLAGFRVVARAESALLLNNDHCPGPQKGPALLPPYTTGIVRIRSNLDIKLGRVIGGWQWRAADRRCASRCGHSSRGASGLGVAFVGVLCRRIDSQGVDPRSLNWKISSPGEARDRSPRPSPCCRA